MAYLQLDIALLLPDHVDQITLKTDEGEDLRYVYTDRLLEKNCVLQYVMELDETDPANAKVVICCDTYDENNCFKFYLFHSANVAPSPLVVYRVIMDAIEYLEKNLFGVHEIEAVFQTISQIYYASFQEKTEADRKDAYAKHIQHHHEILQAIDGRHGSLFN